MLRSYLTLSIGTYSHRTRPNKRTISRKSFFDSPSLPNLYHWLSMTLPTFQYSRMPNHTRHFSKLNDTNNPIAKFKDSQKSRLDQ
jgi:hypothetical protein